MSFISKHPLLAVALLIATTSFQYAQARGDMPPQRYVPGDFNANYPPFSVREVAKKRHEPTKPIPIPTHFELASKATTHNGRQFAQGTDTLLKALRANGGLTIEQQNQLRELELLLASRAPGEVGAALEQLAGSQNANLASATQKTTDQVSAGLLSALYDMPDQDEGRFWAQGLDNAGTLDGQYGAGRLKHGNQGLLLGLDWELDPFWRMGVMGGRSTSNLDARRFNATLDSWHLGAYAVRKDGPLALRLGAIHSRHEGKNQRSVDIDFLNYTQRLNGRYNAQSQNAFAELGYTLGGNTFSIEPVASLGYQRYDRRRFKETGGEAALNVGAQSQQNLSSTFGVRMATRYRFDNHMSLTPSLSAHWKHLYGDVSSQVNQSSRLIGLDGTDGLSTGFTIQGTSLDRNTLAVRAGLDLALSAQHTVGLAYTSEIATHSSHRGLLGQWQMTF